MKQLYLFLFLWGILLGSVANAGVAVQTTTSQKLASPTHIQHKAQAAPIPKKIAFWTQLTTFLAQPIDRWHSEVNPSALTSFISGILALGGAGTLLMAKTAIQSIMPPAVLLYISVGLGVVALIFGMIAFMNMRNHKHLFTGQGLAIGGLLMGMIAAVALMASLSMIL